MKTNTNHSKKIILSLFAVLLPLLLSAESVVIDGIGYNVILKAKTAGVTGVTSGYNGVVNIPSTIIYEGVECDVTSIVSSAFYNRYNVTSIILPESIVSIGERTFEGCSSLTSINIPKGVTSIGRKAFYDCANLTSIIIPDGVTSIEDHTFLGCKKLTSVSLPENITSIGEHAFYQCESLTDFTIPQNVTSIGKRAFYYCKKLTSITIPNGVTSVEELTFTGCSSLTAITVPEGVTSIGKQAFSYCTNLTTIVLPKSVTNIGDFTFGGCERLSDVYCYSKERPGAQSTAFNSSYPEYATLHVPEIALEKYKAATPWNKFGAIKALPKYKISYFVDDEVYHTDSIEHRDDIILIENPVKEGYTFSGWSEVPDTMPTNDIIVSGSFTINKYLITFIVDGEVVASDSLVYGTPIVVPEILEKEGYTFIGWEDVAETVPASNMTYEGKYVANYYKLTYVVDGEIVQVDTIAFGTSITLAKELTKEGYTFSGWSEVPETMPINDLIVCGTFTINKYLVTFKIGDEVIASDSLEYGASIIAPEAPEKVGYTFNGWGEVEETVPAGDVTIEGSYSVNSYLLTFAVDGEVVQSDSIVYGSVITLPEVPTMEGYTFSGWSEAPETMPAEDLSICGTFTINKYLVTFKIGDEVVASGSLEYGVSIVAPKAPEKVGYTFNGWGEVAETVPAHDVTYEGSYSINSYTLTYVVDGEVVLTLPILYGGSIPSLKVPVKEGYTFSGWGEIPETMPAEDVTIEGSFTRFASISLTINQADNGCVKQHLVVGTVCTFTIVAAEGWKIHSVTFNGEDVTAQLTEEGTFTTPALSGDAVLNIAYEKIEDNTMVENARANAIRVQGHQGTLCITGATEGTDISVYTTDGMLVTQESAEEGETLLTLPEGQVYIVTVGDKVMKIGM